jgi:hypothetical protein
MTTNRSPPISMVLGLVSAVSFGCGGVPTASDAGTDAGGWCRAGAPVDLLFVVQTTPWITGHPGLGLEIPEGVDDLLDAIVTGEVDRDGAAD